MAWLRAQSAWWVAALVAVLVSGSLLVLRPLGVLEPFELGVFDRFLVWLRPAQAADPRLLLVVVRESDIARFGHPLPDAVLARALETLATAAPRAIGVDLYRDHPVPPGAPELERVLGAHPEILVIEKIGAPGDDGVAAPAYLAGSQVGFSDVALDRDGRVRRALLMLHHGGEGRLSLSLQVALRYLAAEGVAPRWSEDAAGAEATLVLGRAALARFRAQDGGYVDADDAGYQLLLAHPRGRVQFDVVGLGELLDGSVPATLVRGRAALLGTVAPSVLDILPTPYGELPGVEHHALVASELLDRALDGARGLATPGESAERMLVLLCGLAGALLASQLRSPWALPATVFALLGGLAGAGALLFRAGLWLPLVPMGAAFVVSGGLVEAILSFREERDRRRVMDLFGRFLARDVAAEIWRERDAYLDGGRPRAHAATLTVLMTDLAGYSSVSESHDAPQLMAWIDDYLDAIARTVGAHGGIVDDFAGDGVKANFGVPLPRTSEAEIDADARAAVACALALGPEIERLNARWTARGFPPARVRAGIHTGPAVVGVIGSAERMKFTSVGDTVNTAARLEQWHGDEFRAGHETLRVLVSGETWLRLGGAFEAEALGKLELKGKAEPVAVFRVAGAARSGGGTS